MKFGKWTVIGDFKNRHVLCECDCGTKRYVLKTDLTRSNPKMRSTSCGCARVERFAKITRKHGYANKCPEYRIWKHIRARCNNPNNAAYKWYGAKGIVVCEEWDDFGKFYEDMGPRPKGLTIERIDNNGPYAPWNCEWATMKKNVRNRSITVMIIYKGQKISLGEACELSGISYDLAHDRLSKGYHPKEIFRKIGE